MAPGSIKRTSVQMSRPQKQDSPVAQDRCWSRECFCSSYQFLFLMPSSNALIYRGKEPLFLYLSAQSGCHTQKTATPAPVVSNRRKKEDHPKSEKNQLVPTGQSAIKLTDLIQQIETVAPEALCSQDFIQAIQLSHFIQFETVLYLFDLFDCPV